MRVLVTGACGTIGKETVAELLRRGHVVRGTDVAARRNRSFVGRYSWAYPNRFEFIPGDLRSSDRIAECLADVDAVIHLAAVIPPAADRDPVLAESVNVGITRNLVVRMATVSPSPRLIFSSSIAVYGDRVAHPYIEENDPLAPNIDDSYARQKVACEKIIRESSLEWTILRLSYIVSPQRLVMDPLMFRMPLPTSIEPCTAVDAARACAAAAESANLASRTLLIAGGAAMRTTYREYLNSVFRDFGLGRPFLPEEAFATSGYHCGFMNTSESENELHYQHCSLAELYREIAHESRHKRRLLRLFRPAARLYVLGRSEYFRVTMFERYRSAATRFLRTLSICLGIAGKKSGLNVTG